MVQYIWKPSWRRWLIRWVWKNRFGFFSILKIQWLRWGGSVLSRRNHVWGVWETQGSYDCSFRKREQVSLQRLGVRSAALKAFAMRGSLHLILRTTKGSQWVLRKYNMMMIQCVFINKNKSRLTDIKNKLMVTEGESGGGQGDKSGVLD